jgi:hypothetical protein
VVTLGGHHRCDPGRADLAPAADTAAQVRRPGPQEMQPGTFAGTIRSATRITKR